jgi:drug/metabolite transporter (DMT)-like permease
VPPATWKTWTALGIVYVVWGSTYLAIRFVVDGDLPAFSSAAVRHGVAALLLAAYLAVRRGLSVFRATGRQWLNGGVIGLLLLLGGNGGVVLAEEHDLPSGLAALLVAAVPLVVVAMRWGLGDRASGRTLLGVAVGFGGLALLLLPGSRPAGVSAFAVGLVIFATFTWSAGSVMVGRVTLPADPLVTCVAQMAGGSVGLVVAALVRGESVAVGDATTKAWWALAYLVVFGSVIAFTAYSWLLGTAPISQVSTYAYVNPVVAVLLGALLADERLTATGLLGGAVTLLAVFIVVSEEAQRARGRAYEPIERQGRVRSSAT